MQADAKAAKARAAVQKAKREAERRKRAAVRKAKRVAAAAARKVAAAAKRAAAAKLAAKKKAAAAAKVAKAKAAAAALKIKRDAERKKPAVAKVCVGRVSFRLVSGVYRRLWLPRGKGIARMLLTRRLQSKKSALQNELCGQRRLLRRRQPPRRNVRWRPLQQRPKSKGEKQRKLRPQRSKQKLKRPELPREN